MCIGYWTADCHMFKLAKHEFLTNFSNNWFAPAPRLCTQGLPGSQQDYKHLAVHKNYVL